MGLFVVIGDLPEFSINHDVSKKDSVEQISRAELNEGGRFKLDISCQLRCGGNVFEGKHFMQLFLLPCKGE